ncbi:protein of unknown function [Azospirillum baldaniorum]|uniref:Uncharacterized protein n=1 Tax=Azospirillum baldaniorum TaxID=1064539 RepID=A0A9P1JPI6_9PROT|nr:protein of unknown function [Azospirillum baldaniorum]
MAVSPRHRGAHPMRAPAMALFYACGGTGRLRRINRHGMSQACANNPDAREEKG